jgi:hypothetical protein
MSSFKISPFIGIIANSTSPTNRLELIEELGEPREGIFAPLEFSYKHLKGGIVPLDIQPLDVLSLEGMRKGRLYLERAVLYLIERGAKVICLAASTKRLAGKSGEFLKKKYPEIIFTIGDNATSLAFQRLIEASIAKDFDKKKDKILVLGAGFLGLEAINFLLSQKCKNIIVVSEQKLDLPIKQVSHVKEVVAPVKLLIACTHKYDLQAGELSFLDPLESKIIDVAVPAGVSPELFQSLSETCQRFDAGNFWLKDISYDFAPSILSLGQKEVFFGCFTEAVMLTLAYEKKEKLLPLNFFEINKENKRLILDYLKGERAMIPILNRYIDKIFKCVLV